MINQENCDNLFGIQIIDSNSKCEPHRNLVWSLFFFFPLYHFLYMIHQAISLYTGKIQKKNSIIWKLVLCSMIGWISTCERLSFWTHIWFLSSWFHKWFGHPICSSPKHSQTLSSSHNSNMDCKWYLIYSWCLLS